MLIKSNFESNITRKDVCRIEDFSDLGKIGEALDRSLSHIIVKVNEEKVDIVNFLLKRGFLYSSSTISFKSMLRENIAIDKDKDKFRSLYVDDLPTLYQISDTSFSTNNRFANDPFLSHFVNDIHRKWVENSLKGYADFCCGFIRDGKISAFTTLHIYEDSSLIGLLATSRESRNMGIASKLIDYVKDFSFSQGISTIRASTESTNYPALSLYIKKGFIVYKSEISLYRQAR
jgi:ribosomal protein S18 acetylase RimI-like enzyme